MKKNVKKRRKVNGQKIFSFVSFIFVLVCIFWYGGRTIYFYQDSKKVLMKEANTIARTLKTQNHDHDNFKQIHTSYYYYGDVNNNYIMYSNILWRIIKVNEDNSVVLITDAPITTLAYGEKTTYQHSPILKWLNTSSDEYSGILESKLNKKEQYLVKNTTCIDTIENVNKITCDQKNQDYYLGLLSLQDYINTGGNKSFINNQYHNYLANQKEDMDVWYMNDEGKLDTTSGSDMYGIKAVITLSPTLEVQSGDGSKENPYLFETETNFYGSYVKLGEDIWRIYEEKDNIVKLVFNDYLKVENEIFQYPYSKNSYYHNDTVYGSLAYYLNHTYLNQLSYKDLIVENQYANGYYGIDTNYDYTFSLKTMIDTKVTVPSIGNILWNNTLDNYFTATGNSKESSLVYLQKQNGTNTIKNVTTEQAVVPCISIKKENLKVGTGSSNDPYRTE